MERICPPSGRIKSDDDRQRVGAPRNYFVEGLLADSDMPSPEPVLENVASPSGRLESDNNRDKAWPLPIPEATCAHSMGPRQIYEAILKRMRRSSGRIKSDDDRRWVGPPRNYFVEDLLADWDAPSPEPVLQNVASPSGRSKSERNQCKSWLMLIPGTIGAHTLCQRHVVGAMLKRMSPPPGRIKSDDDRQWVGPLWG